MGSIPDKHLSENKQPKHFASERLRILSGAPWTASCVFICCQIFFEQATSNPHLCSGASRRT